MRARFLIILAAAVVLVLVARAAAGPATEGPDATADEELWKRANLMFDPIPATADNPDNRVTAAKIELGRMLYFDTKLSQAGNISCNSCHSLATFGVDNLPTSRGDAGQLGERNSPTVLNAALHVAQFWDGRAKDVEEQAGMPILNPVEMAIPSKDFLVDRLSQYPHYERRFVEAFPGELPALTYTNIVLALAAFERTLLTPSRFDLYLLGDHSALSAEEKAGMKTFMGYGCTSCHNGVNLGGHIFRKFGISGEYWHHTNSRKIDPGRFAVTGEEEDRYVFRVASLRNVAKTYPYFHDGSVQELDDAIRVMLQLQVGSELSEPEVAGVTAFLESLTGELPESVRQTMPAGVAGD
ncbi:MAG: cytochrome-c peroxidase [bacterium]|nr:cytochrome-c peroxidase [bacterium]